MQTIIVVFIGSCLLSVTLSSGVVSRDSILYLILWLIRYQFECSSVASVPLLDGVVRNVVTECVSQRKKQRRHLTACAP